MDIDRRKLIQDEVRSAGERLAAITGLEVARPPGAPGVMVLYDCTDEERPWVVFSTYFTSQFGGRIRSLMARAEDPHKAGELFLEENLKRLRDELLYLQEGRCKFCLSVGPLQLDHISPRSHGRNDRLENLQLLCERCHRRKTGDLQWSKPQAGATG